MAKLDKTYVHKKKLEFLTIQEYIDKFHPGLTVPAITYAIDNDKIDYMQPGRERFVILTKLTLSYTPINHPNRTRMEI